MMGGKTEVTLRKSPHQSNCTVLFLLLKQKTLKGKGSSFLVHKRFNDMNPRWNAFLLDLHHFSFGNLLGPF